VLVYNSGTSQRKGNQVSVVAATGASWRVLDGVGSDRISSRGRVAKPPRVGTEAFPSINYSAPATLVVGACNTPFRENYEPAVFLTFWFLLAASALWGFLLKYL